VFFSVREPEGPEAPLVVEVPHAGLWIDPESVWTIAAPARSIGRDADLYVDELYEAAPSHGATVLVSHVSRYVCDLNREEGDIDHLAVEGAPSRNAPHGLIWRSTTDDQPALFAPLTRRELNRRLDLVYRPYHRTLRELLERKRRQFGFAILLCAHSMPSLGRAGHGDTGKPRADIVPGSRGGTSAASAVIAVPDALAQSQGWSVRHDDPYRGGYSTGHYGRPHEKVHAIQIELARRLYMEEQGLTKKRLDFEMTRQFCTGLVARLAQLDLA